MFRHLAILLLILVCSPVLFKAGLLAWFAGNQPEITAKHCINRSRPKMKCQGKCYLAKHLKKIDQPIQNQELPLPVKLWEKAETAPFLPTNPTLFVGTVAMLDRYSQALFSALCLADQMVFRQIFKPPA